MSDRYLAYCRFVAVPFFLVIVCIAGSKAFGSTQYWPSAGIVWDVNGPWMLQFKESYYYFHEDSQSDHSKSDISAIYKGKDNIYDVGIGFAYVDGSEKTKQEQRPYLSTTLRGKIFDRDVSNRFMVEYRDLSESSDYWRFRDKVTFNIAFDSLDTRGIRLLNSERFRPYVADEVFFNSNGQGFSQNRVYVGLRFKIIENIGVDTYYLLQTIENSSDKWQNNNIIGVDLILRF